ncbi:hypothetical protein TNCV_365931 [Trichonephila clavipes]|nr:hypothetical protein TNCV_365931 [Trichonephila clavipes]
MFVNEHGRNGGTLNSSRATSPVVRLGKERWAALTPPSQGVILQNWGGTESNRTVTCIMLKATANNRRKTSPSL